jgi:hypothetical protein
MDEIVPWTGGGLCEYNWQLGGPFAFCRKRARWMVGGELRCGEHKAPQMARSVAVRGKRSKG